MINFKKDEWVLCFSGRDARVELVRVAQNVYDQTECLVYVGNYTTRYSTDILHKLPVSMKKLLPKDQMRKLATTNGI